MPQLDSSFIAQGVKAPQIEDPSIALREYQQSLALQRQAALAPLQAQKLQGEVEQTGLENQKIQQANAAQARTTRGQATLADALQKNIKQGDDGKFSVDHEGVKNHLVNAGFGPEAILYDKEKRAELDDALKRQEKSLDVAGKVAAKLGSAAQSLLDIKDPLVQGTALKGTVDGLVKEGVLDQTNAQKVLALIGPDGAVDPKATAQLKQWASQALTVKDQHDANIQAVKQQQTNIENEAKNLTAKNAKYAALFVGINDREGIDRTIKAIAAEDPEYAKRYLERLPSNVQAALRTISLRALTPEQRANLDPKATWESMANDPNETPERRALAKATLDDIQKRAIATEVGKQTEPLNSLLGSAPGSNSASSGSIVIPETAPGQKGQQLAFKNNNPGNLMFANQPGAEQGEGGFAKFKTPEDGHAAILRQIGIDAKGGLTLEQYISKYAPAGHGNNDPVAYTRGAAAALGVDPKVPLGSVDAGKLAAFQAKQESGTTVAPTAGSGAPARLNEQGFNEAVLSGKSPEIIANVKKIAAGDLPLPNPAGRGPIAIRNAAIHDLAILYDPSLQGSEAGQRVKTANDFRPGGKNGQSINAIGTALKHADKLSELIDGLDNTNYPKFNNITNWIANNKGAPEVQRFENTRNKLGAELVRAWTAVGGSRADREDEIKTLNAANSPSQLRSVLADDVDLLMGKYTEHQSQYRGSMGRDLPEGRGISKEAEDAAAKIKAKSAGGGTRAPIPSGAGVRVSLKKPLKDGSTTVLFPNKEAAESFKKDHPNDVN